ncbi:MAG TPA: hypothetical protein DIC60_04980 [Lachnospiraceae bacterium]|nr:hypothetical protein [Lachnospiraceae bacterium]
MFSIDDFYEHFNDYCESNDLIYRLYSNDNSPEVWSCIDDDEARIAKCFIQVTDVYRIKKKLIVCYVLELDSYYNEVNGALLKRQIVFPLHLASDIKSTPLDRKEIDDLVKVIKTIDPNLIYNEKFFRKAVTQYIKFALAVFVGSDTLARCKIGWTLDNENKWVYIGVTHEPIGNATQIDETLFQIKDFDFENLVKDNELYLLEDIENSSQEERHILIQESMEIVLIELKKNPDLCVLFAYDILALTYYYLDTPDIKRFPIAVCGKGNAAMAKIVANVFCNMQLFDPSRPNTIAKDTNIQYTSIFCKLDNYVCYADITMLMPVRGSLYKRKDYTLVKIISDTMLDEINYFPVFVTDKESKIREIIDVDVSKFKNFPCQRNSKELIDLKVSINRLLLEYILFNCKAASLCDKGDPHTISLKNKIRLKASKQVVNFKNSKNLDENVDEQYILYLEAMNYFYQFLKISDCKNLANDLHQLCFKVFKMRASDSETTPSDDNIVIESFKNYILTIFENKELKPNYFYVEGVEKRGRKEYCYYLDFNKFYPHFLDINPEISIDERGFLHILKSFGLIKTKDDTCYGVERKFEGMEKKIYVLAVIKEKINIL